MPDVVDVHLADGRSISVYDSGEGATPAPVVLWYPGSPHSGRPLAPLLEAATARGIRLVSLARPGYGGSTRRPGRDVASIAVDTAAVLHALGIERFVAVGYSGGGPHALACGALLPDRVAAIAGVSCIAPMTDGLDWWTGMQSTGALRSAVDGTAARERFAATDEFDPASFTAADWAALAGPWADLGRDASAAGETWPMGLVDDDVAFVRPWGFGLEDVAPPVMLVQGEEDRVVPADHARWLHAHLPASDLRLLPGAGHVSALDAVPGLLDWILAAG
jgi:pimeloyl-ACP methyl ester carboxylesterase